MNHDWYSHASGALRCRRCGLPASPGTGNECPVPPVDPVVAPVDPGSLIPAGTPAEWPYRDPDAFLHDLAAMLNRHSAENASNTPDFILAVFLGRCLSAWNEAIVDRDRWYRLAPVPGDRRPRVQPGGCDACGDDTVSVGDRWACLGCGTHGGVAEAR